MDILWKYAWFWPRAAMQFLPIALLPQMNYRKTFSTHPSYCTMRPRAVRKVYVLFIVPDCCRKSLHFAVSYWVDDAGRARSTDPPLGGRVHKMIIQGKVNVINTLLRDGTCQLKTPASDRDSVRRKSNETLTAEGRRSRLSLHGDCPTGYNEVLSVAARWLLVARLHLRRRANRPQVEQELYS